jgi:hypothetical protein
LRCSGARSISIYGEIPPDLAVAKVQTIFQLKPASSRRGRRRSDEFEFSFSDRRKADLPPIESLDIDSDDLTPPEIPDHPYVTGVSNPRMTQKKTKKHFKKAELEFEGSSDQLLSRIKSVSTQFTDECRDLRTFLQNQNRFISKAAVDFRQQSLELSRTMHQSMAEVETVHQVAYASIASRQAMVDVPSQAVAYPYMAQPPGLTSSPRKVSHRFHHGHD